MKLTISTEEKTHKRVYKRIPPHSQSKIEVSAKKLDYFYIGRKSSDISVLTNSFESGYFADNLHNVKTMLKRLIEQTNTIPDIIIAEASLGFTALYKLYQLISSINELATVPFLVDGSNVTVDELTRFRNYKFIDEIIFLKDYSKQQLISKLLFCKKIKQQVVSQKVNNYNETSVPILKILNRPSSIFKRLFDIVLSSTLLIALSPLFFIIIVALRIESKGPVFYVAKRAGRGYKIFDFYKFRSMVVKADGMIHDFSHLNQYTVSKTETPVFIKINNDPRVTKLGSFLRNCSLDELPQLVNVLKGDMSMVGNRPLPLYEAASLTTDHWAERFMAPAGITGLWQIKKRGKENMSVEERIKLDIKYANTNNFLYDLWILANTPPALIQKTNV